MPCYHPLRGYRAKRLSKTGRRPIVFTPSQGYVDLPVDLPCGQCIGCRLERSRQWAMRCVHEASTHECNSFITLTYSDSHLPAGGTLVKRDLQLFFKRLRKFFSDLVIKYYGCGEYGENFSRPHYHVCLFGVDFPDKVLWSVRDDVSLYRSVVLERLWPYGYSTIGDVTFESAAYVARYCTKIVTGKDREVHYAGLLPEFALMSRRPGIGKTWFDSFRGDCYPKDFVTVRGVRMHPPRYYDYLYDIAEPEEFAKVKAERSRVVLSEDSSLRRLQDREVVKLAQFTLLRRGIEDDSC